jgi:hypothetical protein
MYWCGTSLQVKKNNTILVQHLEVNIWKKHHACVSLGTEICTNILT